MAMRSVLIVVLIFITVSCRKYLKHERWIANATPDTVFVFNPDFEDTIFVVAPSQKTLIYTYEMLDKKNTNENCAWMGDTLLIENSKDSVCEKSTSLEYNWSSDISGDDPRIQICTFTIYPDHF